MRWVRDWQVGRHLWILRVGKTAQRGYVRLALPFTVIISTNEDLPAIRGAALTVTFLVFEVALSCDRLPSLHDYSLPNVDDEQADIFDGWKHV